MARQIVELQSDKLIKGINFHAVQVILQIILLAKDLHEKRASNIPFIKNPNEKYSDDLPKSPAMKGVKNSSLKLVVNDRYIPPKSLLKVLVFEKVSFPGFNRKYQMILGHSNLILAKFSIFFILKLLLFFFSLF